VRPLNFTVRRQPMTDVSAPRDNPESWCRIHTFIAEYPNDAIWTPWKSMAEHIVATLEARKISSHVRVGQSMHHIVFSTADHHRLTNEPRVTIELLPRDDSVRVAYSTSNIYFAPPAQEERVGLSDAEVTIVRYLRRLWTDTRPLDAIPHGLVAV
jgi:hypothetical protein